MKYAEGRKAAELKPTDSVSERLLYIYRLLVHDKVMQLLPEDQLRKRRCGTSCPFGTQSSCRRIILY